MKKPETCRHLRTKSMYYNPGDVARREEHDTAIFWCLKTFKPVGPDLEPCSAEECGRGRACFDLNWSDRGEGNG